MPVAIRKRSWEDHVTHRSGLQYSYDDLDLVCCHGVSGQTAWVGTGGPKPSRRARCVSMPECCHQPPAADLSQALAVVVTTSNSVESEHSDFVEGSGRVALGFGGNLAGGSELLQRLPESGRAERTDAEDATESSRCSSCAVYNANSRANDDSGRDVKMMKGKGEDDTGSIESHDICDERDDVLARAHSSGEEQQCISICSDNGPPLSASAGEQSGVCPKPQETMESHIDGHSGRAPEPSKNTLTQLLSAELESHTDLPDVEQDKISTTGHVGSMVNLPAAAMDCSINPKENNDSMTNANKTGELIVSVERDKGLSEQRKSDAADKLCGLKDSNAQSETPHTQNETLASHLPSQEHHGLKALAEKDLCDGTMPVVLVHGCEIPHQTALEQQSVEMAAANQAKRGERSGAGNIVGEAEVTFEATPSTDMCAKAQRCPEDMDDGHLTTPEKVDVTQSEMEKRHTQTNNHCIDQATADDVSSHAASKDVTSSPEVQAQAYQAPPLDGGCLKLDTIHEVVSASEADDDNNNGATHNDTAVSVVVVHAPAGPLIHVARENTSAQRQPGCSAEVSGDEPSPEGLHDNQSSGRYVGEPPASEVADGHGRPQAIGSAMEDTTEVVAAAAQATLSSSYSSTQPPGILALDGRREPAAAEQKEESSAVKMRTRKTSRDEREHSHLDSMVLLLMKLDQLDQEIENALSTTSSMDSTPTLRRRHLLEMELGSVPGTGISEGTNPPPHHDGSTPITITTGSASVMGAKPKSGSNSTFAGKEKAEIEAKEACTWLRAAGFPQYAQLYEDALFPIDIASVTRDHDFLDRDAIEALCRRLNTLNKCALMRLEISPQRKRSEDSDEDEPCAISGRWTFQRDSKRWSRMEELEVFSSLPAGASQSSFPQDPVSQTATLTLREGHSSESVLSDLSEQPEVGSIHSSGSGGREEEKNHAGALATQALPTGATRASSVASMCSSSGTGGSGCAIEDSLSDGLPPSPLETLGQFTFDVKAGMGGACLERGFGEGGKSTRSRAKSFLKRMESLNLWSGTSTKRKKKLTTSGGKLEISGPVIKEGLDDNKLRRLNCVDISSIALDHNLNHQRNPAQTMTLNRNRSVSYSTQTSSGSTGSSQSEASSGSAVSTPSPVTRARSHSTAAGSTKRGGMYLEGFDPFSSALQQQASNQQPATPEPKSAPPVPCQAGRRTTVDEQNRRNNHGVRNDNRRVAEEDEEEEEEEEAVIFFYLPEGHKPGTFPKALQDGSSRNGNDNGDSVVVRGRHSRRQRRCSAGSADSRLSFYDNVPYAEREEEEEDEERKLDQVLQHVSGMQRFVNAWSAAVAREDEEEEDEEEEEEEECDSDSALDSASPCPSSPLQNRLEETENGSDQDSTGNPLGEGDDGMRERRDSGVGASLTRTNRPQKLRWPSFQSSHRPSLASAQLQIGCQSVLQMNLLQKLSLLQLTALLEKHTPTNKHGFSWAVPKFMKRIKVRDYKDRNVFGVPLQVNVQRTGQPLPQGIQQAMRYLRNQCLDQVGLFRKSGVKSRIQALRQMNEACGADGGGVNYEGQSAYDVADMLKQYFRDLPEPLLTSKLSETFLQIYQYMPKELRLQAARSAVLLLPDESREALRTLLCLLSDVTAAVAENQMTPTNLAVCLAPSLFHLNTLRRKESSSPRVMNRKQTLGKPDQRDLNENLAATHGLTHMIQECSKLFKIPEEMSRCRNSYVEQALLPAPLEELGGGEEAGPGTGYRTYLRDSLDALLKESKDKFKGYDSCSTPEHAELAYRKVNDGSPLRLWKVTVEVPAGPEEVLTRVLREQAHWDEDLLESRLVETLDERTEVYQYVRNAMAPHPPRDHVVLRTWLTDLPKGACALVCTSVEHAGAPALGVRTNVLTSRYFIEPCGASKSRLTHISRTDCRGRFPEWYNKLYGHLCAAEVVRIRDSFTVSMEK